MTESTASGYHDRSDGGEKDTVLTTDDDAQRDDSVARPGNV